MSLLRVDSLSPTDDSVVVKVADIGAPLESQGASVIGAKSSSIPNAKQRSVMDRLDDNYNVKDFGATGDGVSDDTSSIQSALDYAKEQYALGKRVAVFIPAGI